MLGQSNSAAAPDAAAGSKPQAAAPRKLPGEDYPLLEFESSEAVAQTGITTLPIDPAPLDEYVDASALVGYDQTRLAQLSSRVPGQIWSVEKHLGDWVKKNDVLAIIDAEEVGRAKAEFIQEAQLSYFKAELLERLRSVDPGVIAERSLRETELQVREARVRRFTAQQKLLNLGLPVDLSEKVPLSPEEMARRLQFLSLPQELVERMNPRPTTANLIPLLAPMDGMLIRQGVVVGELVGRDNPQIELADTRTMWVRLSVRKEDAAKLELGQSATFTPDGSSRTFTARLSWISSEIDEKTRTVQARMDVANPLVSPRSSEGDRVPTPGRRVLQANLFGTARIRVQRHPDALVVPENAVQRVGLTPMIFVAQPDGKSFQPRKVRLGLTSNGGIQIVNGLKPHERVVTAGSYVLKSEMMRETLSAGN